MKVVEKKRNWTLIVYPESAPKNWRDILDEEHFQWVESPLHDRDTNPDGEVKKAHWHILVMYDGPVTAKPVQELAQKIISPFPKPVASARGLLRYMIHLDNPEKFQYEKNDIVAHGGADVESYFEMTMSNRLETLKDISRYIISQNICNFSDLVQFAIENDDDWFTIIADKNTLYLNKLIDAQWHKNKQNVIEDAK